MVELVAGYRTDPAVWPSHKQYLTRYSSNYPTMLNFFTGLSDIADRQFETDHERSSTITDYVSAWPGNHQAIPSARSSTTTDPRTADRRRQM